MSDRSKVAFIDTETLGLDPDYHPVWEIAVITEAGERSWFQKVGPRSIKEAEPIALELSGFHDRYDHDAALDPSDSIDRFASLTKGRHLVGMCPWFDSERLHRLHRATLEPINWPGIDRDGTGVKNGYEPRRHPWHYHLIDVETLIVGWMARALHDEPDGLGDVARLPDLPWKSSDLVRLIGIDPEAPEFQPAHQALADARLAQACWDKIMGSQR